SQLQGQLQGAQADFAKSGHASFDISLSVDLSGCASSGYTGSFDMDVKGSIDRTASSASITVNMSMTMHSVCETTLGACVNGGLAEEMLISGASTSVSSGTSGSSSGSGNLSFTLAWNFTATAKDSAGVQQSITSKGGQRLAASG